MYPWPRSSNAASSGTTSGWRSFACSAVEVPSTAARGGVAANLADVSPVLDGPHTYVHACGLPSPEAAHRRNASHPLVGLGFSFVSRLRGRLGRTYRGGPRAGAPLELFDLDVVLGLPSDPWPRSRNAASSGTTSGWRSFACSATSFRNCRSASSLGDAGSRPPAVDAELSSNRMLMHRELGVMDGACMCIERVRAHLRAGGGLFWDPALRSLAVLARPLLVLPRGGAGPPLLELSSQPPGGEVDYSACPTSRHTQSRPRKPSHALLGACRQDRCEH